MSKSVALNILELFAGVGGFRIGFEASDADYFKTVIANQWEPGKKRQDAFETYNKHFPDSLNLNIPVQEITEETLEGHTVDVIVGGFPCFTGDTLVLTKQGYKQIKDIQIGDEVLTHRKRYKKVLNVFNQGLKDIVYLTGEGFDTLKVTDNHKFYVRYLDDSNQLQEPEWLELRELTTQHYLGIAHDEYKQTYQELPNLSELTTMSEGGYTWVPFSDRRPVVGQEIVYDIEVEEDHSFTANNIIAHNCQNYSVASSSKHALGIEGEKGVLLWDIVRLTELTKPKYLLLENVDRLLTSPAKQRGRDFAILLSVFNRLGYTVEWKVMQSDLMGFPQRRKRVFIFMHKQDEPSHLLQLAAPSQPSQKTERNTHLTISDDTLSISDNFTGQFWNAGISNNFNVHTWEEDINTPTQPVLLGDILETDVDESYYYTPEQVERINYLRGSKSFDRVNAQGHAYKYSEGAMSPYDYPTRASRTLLTSEGNVSRTSHVIKDPQTQQYRRLTPIECERLQGFPDNWTEGISKRMRYFTMGNALVTGIVKEIGDQLKKYDESLD